jgi:hypothetical protein
MKKYAVYYKANRYIGEQMIHVFAADENDAVATCRRDGVGYDGGTVYPSTILSVSEVPKLAAEGE